MAVGEHGARPLFKECDARREEVGQPEVVRAEVGEVGPFGLRQTLVERGAQSAVLARDQLAGEGAVFEYVLDDLRRAVARAVVDDEQARGRAGLRQHGAQRRRDVRRVVVGGHDDRDASSAVAGPRVGPVFHPEHRENVSSIMRAVSPKLLPRPAAAALAAPLCAALLAHAYVGLYSRYWYDDFNTAAVLRDRGFLGSQHYWYMNWSGRFSFHLAVNLFESAGPWVVSLLPLAALSAWVAVTAWAVYGGAALLGLPGRARSALLSALLLVYATVESTADVVQSLYWQTGVLTYLAPLILFTANAGLVASSVRREPVRAAPWRIGLCALLALVAGGFSEVSAVLQLGGLSLLLAASLAGARGLRSRGARALILAGFVGALAALLLVALAPGNGVRQGLGAAPAALPWSVESSCRYALYFFEQHTRRWRGTALLCFALPACLALAAGASRLGQSVETPDARRLLRLLAVGTAAGFALIVLCFIPGFYAQSEALPRRAQIIPKFVLVCLNVYWGALAGLALLKATRRGRKALPRTLLAGWCAVAALLFVSPAASARRTFALGARARAYAERWDEADRQIRAGAAAGAREVSVPAVEGVEWELGFGRPELRLSRDPLAPQNVAAARYYGLDSVKVE